MGRYIEWADVEFLYPQAGRGKGADEVASSHIFYAENQLDGLLASHFTAPFSTNNYTVKELAVELTFLRLGQFKDKEVEVKRKEITDRIQALKDGTEAMMVLVAGTLTPVFRSATAWSSTANYPPTFGHGREECMLVSSTQMQDEEDARG